METAASWAGHKDLRGKSFHAVRIGTVCGTEPLVWNNRVHVVLIRYRVYRVEKRVTFVP